MEFLKMHGCGNDYVAIDGRELTLREEKRGALARRLCDRHYGIGADGLLILKTGERAAFEMEMYNPDGSRGISCGNGLRCVGKYLYDRGITRERSFGIETMESVKTLTLVEEASRPGGSTWKVDMGEVTFPYGQDSLEVLGEQLFPVNVGNPHAVLFPGEGEPGEWPVGRLGPGIERAREFPDRINIEFVKVLSRSRIVMRVWERGAGETLACGTGACAAAAVCMQKDLTDEEITVTLLGGELIVSKDRDTGHMFLTGPAVTVFEGDFPLDGEEKKHGKVK
ncbi:MAG: diaminopimelate epimerase [Lachnospiraceae bacterium]|nr:diaminopimelate epimerase [Lachnospiraceae bacterium]